MLVEMTMVLFVWSAMPNDGFYVRKILEFIYKRCPVLTMGHLFLL